MKRISYQILLFILILGRDAASSGIPELSRRVTIQRDTFGIAHITAQDEEAAGFAHGYVTAEDHLKILARLFLRARGQEASVFGPDALASDKRNHELGIWEGARDRFDELPVYMQRILNAYASGYNLYLDSHRKQAPEWAFEVNGVDILAHCRYVLLAEFALDLRPWKAAALPPGTGSNMWAVGRGRSATGRGILLINPHLRWDGEQILQEIQITVPETINIYGATLIGFPVVTMGFNDYLGWSHTVNQLHSDDVYELALDPDDSSKYMYEGTGIPFKYKTYSINVKTSSETERREFQASSTQYGPVIRISNGKVLVYKSVNLGLVNFLTEYNQMGKAHNYAEFRAALNMMQLPMFNIGYADRAGNVFFVSMGRIPIRPAGYDWSGTVPGGTWRTEWFAIHPLYELPQLLNPESGYIQNCNDAPWYATRARPIDPETFPKYMRVDGLTPRGQRSLQLLEAERSFTLEEVLQSKLDETVMPAERLKRTLIGLAREKSEDRNLAEAADVLEAWDNRASANSRGAVLFDRWWQKYADGSRRVWTIEWSASRPFETPNGLADAPRAIAALESAASELRKEFGTIEVRWGEVHRLRRGTLDLPVGGEPGLLRTIMYSRDHDGRFAAIGGDSFVLAVDFEDTPRARSISAYSASSDPQSRHYSDQTELFAREQYKPVLFTPAMVQANLERTYRPGE